MDLEDLVEIERIKQLKARYFRHLDRQEWPHFLDLFTDDAVMFNEEYGIEVVGKDAIRTHVVSSLQGCRSVHHGHMPEITVDLAAGTATGIWAMYDFLEFADDPARKSMKGYGHYEELYRLEDSTWRITRLELVRLRADRHRPVTRGSTS